jgi:hypothetical protein
LNKQLDFIAIQIVKHKGMGIQCIYIYAQCSLVLTGNNEAVGEGVCGVGEKRGVARGSSCEPRALKMPSLKQAQSRLVDGIPQADAFKVGSRLA